MSKKIVSLVMAILLLCVFGVFALGSGESSSTSGADSQSTETTTETATEVVYEAVELQTMFDALDENAMKAENTYQGKAIEFTCQIASFDSDGSYISVEPVGAGEWNFTTAMCYIKNDAQKEYLMEKNVGDTITIKGKITSIGEVLGYSIDIDEVF